MDKRLILGIGIGVVIGAVLVFAILGITGLVGGDRSSAEPVSLSQTDEAVAETDIAPPTEAAAPDPRPAVEAAQRRPEPPRVVINGRALTSTQLEEIKEQYGVAPAAGNYWYDPRSGLFGVTGQVAAGFMLPEHDFGPLPEDASRGDTGVVVNGRIIPQDEHAVLNLIWGTYIQPSRYWLDAWGNVGYEGMDVPVANLFLQIHARVQAGYGGGDSIWSSRYGAGNYTPDNSAGYVSVPGHGPIGYGN